MGNPSSRWETTRDDDGDDDGDKLGESLFILNL